MPRKTHPDRADQVALAIAEGQKLSDWARSVGLNVRTVYRIAERPEVRAKAAEIRSTMVDRAIGYLADYSARAALTLVILMNEEKPDSIRLSAARAILSDLVAVRSHAEIERRLAEIEAKLTPGVTGKGKQP